MCSYSCRRSHSRGQKEPVGRIRDEKYHRSTDQVDFIILVHFQKLIHLRTEHIEQAQKRDAHIKASAAIPQSNEAVAGPLKIPGITYHDINFNGSAFSRMLISKLTWMQFFRLIALMAIGRRLDAIKILAPSMEAMGLVGLATSSMDVCTKEVREVFEVYADEKNWPLMIHCTQGKDRTGLSIALILFILEVPLEAISHDYCMSEEKLLPERESRLKEIHEIGLSDDFAGCPADFINKIYEYLENSYGGVGNYLTTIGFKEKERAALVHELKA